MKRETVSLLSAVIIGLSLIAAAFLLREPAGGTALLSVPSAWIPGQANVMNEEEAAVYLNMTAEQLQEIIAYDENVAKTISSYDDSYFLPYGVLNGERFYLKTRLDDWLNTITMSGNYRDLPGQRDSE